MAWPVIGRAFSPAEFEQYVRSLKWDGAFQPLFMVVHNSAAPSLAQRPNGLTRQHILNLQAYYRDEKGWKGGPHLFIDDNAIWVFNDLTKFGTHSPSWNSVALGIEMLGDYDTESFTEGRGRKVRDNTVAAMAILNKRLGFAADNFKFHIEDKKTTHACPGKLARDQRDALIAEIAAAMAQKAPPPAEVSAPATTGVAGKIGKTVEVVSTATAATKDVARVAYESRSLWAALAGIFSLVWGVLTDWAQGAFDWLLWSLNLVPTVTREVHGVVDPLKEVSLWFKVNLSSIALTISALCCVIFIVRHLLLRLEAKAKT